MGKKRWELYELLGKYRNIGGKKIKKRGNFMNFWENMGTKNKTKYGNFLNFWENMGI